MNNSSILILKRNLSKLEKQTQIIKLKEIKIAKRPIIELKVVKYYLMLLFLQLMDFKVFCRI
jgi:hypothetical protein